MTTQTDKPRGGPALGQKWVDLNHGAIENAKSLNGGIEPPSIALYTSHYPNKEKWSTEALPEVLFYLQLPENPHRDVKPDKFTRADGCELRKFDTLPDYVSVNVEGWLVQAWRSVDDRIMLQDILDRMVEDTNYFGHTLKKPPKNGLSNDCYRGCRKILGSYNDYIRRDQPHRTMVESVEKLSYEKLWMNTVLDRSVEYPDRLVRVKFVRGGDDETGQYKAVPVEVTPENYLETTFPMEHFCLEEFDPCVIGKLEKDLEPAMSTLWDLQKKAELHGLEDWKKLERECLPESWYDRTKGGAPEKLTFDGGCEICTWTPGHDAPAPKPQPFNFEYLRQRSASKMAEIDLTKAFCDDETKYVTPVRKHVGLLRRGRERHLDKFDSNSSTLPSPYTTATHSAAYPEAGRPLKRYKYDMSTSPILVQTSTVPDFPSSTPLNNETKYNIKYLECDDSSRGFWDTDTEVDLDSDSGTITNLNETPSQATKRFPSFVAGTPPSLPGAPIDPALQRQDGIFKASVPALKKSAASVKQYRADQQQRGYMPIEFIGNKYVKQEGLVRDRSRSQTFIPTTLLEDPFSLSDNTSSLANLGEWTYGLQPDFTVEKNDEAWNNLDEQAMHSLQQHSATLHGVMGFDARSNNALRNNISSFHDSFTLAGTDSFQSFDTPIMSHIPGVPSYSAQAPMTPANNNAPGCLANLMWSDEFNRFEDFDSLVDVEAAYESPLKKFNPSQPAPANMAPLSPRHFAVVKANHPLYGRKTA